MSARPHDDESTKTEKESGSLGSVPDTNGIQDFCACPVCGGPLVEIRMKRQCARCHTICETCCEGGRE